jgi:hypothetical protein
MTRDKKPSKATEDEHMALEDAMSELNKQTDALLTENKKSSEVKKPTLPKKTKKVVPHKKGASLDIVGHQPSTVRRHVSVHKDGEEPEKIPEHAGLSYNERPTKKTEKTAKPSIQHHAGKRLDITSGAVVATKKVEEPEEKVDVPPEQEDELKLAPLDEVLASEEPHEETEEAPTIPEPVKAEVKKEPPAKQPIKDEDVLDFDEPETKPTQTEKSDDGIVKLAEGGKEKPTLYDTTEYQTELHDWSKLSKNSHWSFVVLILLVGVAGVLAYLYFTNSLPEFF